MRRTAWSLAFGLLIVWPAPFPDAFSWLAREAELLPLEAAPTTLYARPFRIELGQSPERMGLRDQLLRLGYRAVGTADPEPGEFAGGAREIVIERRGFVGPDGRVPAARLRLELGRHGLIERILDAHGGRESFVELEPEVLARLYREPRAERIRVPIDTLPAQLVRAVLAVEDQRFYEHRGLDPQRIAGALLANLRAGSVVQGGSTITQQLVKNLYLSQERTLARKLREARLAWRIERRLTKQQILEAYLNEIYLGQDGAHELHGVAAAAWHYFSKPASELSLAESALIAGLIRAPNRYRPFQHPERALERRDQVLEALLEAGEITRVQHDAARATPLALRRGPLRVASAGYFLDLAQPQLALLLERDELERGQLAVHTSLDARLQRLAERAVREGLSALERSQPRLRDRNAPLQGALVALDARTGEVLALVGGRSWARYPFNRAVHARRQPGSAFKPIVALAAIARNGRIAPSHTLASPLADEPLELATDDGDWSPENHDGSFRGRVSLRTALEQSLNVPIARLALEIGPDQVIRAARRLGIESRLAAVPSLALGSYELTLLELTRAYATLAAGGRRPELQTVRALSDAEGGLRMRTSAASTRVYEPDEIYLLTSALRGVVERGTGRGLNAQGYLAPIAGKTGTTNGYRDGWFIGYTTELVVGVWVGYDDGRGMNLPGSRTSLPLFARFLREAGAGRAAAEFSPPPGVEQTRIDPETGLLADDFCTGEPEVFLAGTAPTLSCGGGFWRRHDSLEDELRGEVAPIDAIRARALAMEAELQRARRLSLGD